MNYAVVNANSTDNAESAADDQGCKSLVEATAEKSTFTIPDMNTKQMKISTDADGNIEIKAKNKTSVMYLCRRRHRYIVKRQTIIYIFSFRWTITDRIMMWQSG